MTKKQDDNNEDKTNLQDDQESLSDDSTREDVSQVKEDFEDLQQKFEDVSNQLKRAVADYRNLERRVAEGRSELNTWASADLVERILPTLDHLEMVVNLGKPVLADKEELKEWFRGVELAVNQLKTTLKEEGLEEIVADGQFNPNLQEAIDTAPGEEDQILKVAQRGYTLKGKVIRPAKVVVGRKDQEA